MDTKKVKLEKIGEESEQIGEILEQNEEEQEERNSKRKICVETVVDLIDIILEMIFDD